MITSDFQFEWKYIFSWVPFSFNNNNWLNFYSLLTLTKLSQNMFVLIALNERNLSPRLWIRFVFPPNFIARSDSYLHSNLDFNGLLPIKPHWLDISCLVNVTRTPFTLSKENLFGRLVVKFIVILGNIWLFYFACYGTCFIWITAHIFSTMIIQESIKLL